MPMYLSQTDVSRDVADLESVLIVPCRFCPAATLAVKNEKPYIELFRRFFKTASYERLIETMKRDFERKGTKVNVFRSRLLHQFVLCMWSTRRRKKLRERARQHDAVVVLGCEAAGETVRNALESTECRVIQGMRSEGVMSIQPKLRLPCNISLELQSVTPVVDATQQRTAGAERSAARK